MVSVSIDGDSGNAQANSAEKRQRRATPAPVEHLVRFEFREACRELEGLGLIAQIDVPAHRLQPHVCAALAAGAAQSLAGPISIRALGLDVEAVTDVTAEGRHFVFIAIFSACVRHKGTLRLICRQSNPRVW